MKKLKDAFNDNPILLFAILPIGYFIYLIIDDPSGLLRLLNNIPLIITIVASIGVLIYELNK